MKSFQLPSPLEQLTSNFLTKNDVQLFVKRDDLVHPMISGNKWRKLKHNIAAAKQQGKKQLITFGGAFSNHLIATAAAGKLLGFKTIGIVRGEEPKKWSETLNDCKAEGMQLKFISRSDYSLKNQTKFLEQLEREYGESFIIPEGGANDLGSKGCKEIIQEIEVPFDFVCCSAGTGTTAAGILSMLSHQNLLAFSALKGGGFLNQEILSYADNQQKSDQLQVLENYHFGGYAKVTEELIDFVNEFYRSYHLKLDLVYTAKLFFGVFDLIQRNCFPKGSLIVLIHSGGLQGNRGIESRGNFKLFDS